MKGYRDVFACHGLNNHDGTNVLYFESASIQDEISCKGGRESIHR
jgi:hypothetical protein